LLAPHAKAVLTGNSGPFSLSDLFNSLNATLFATLLKSGTFNDIEDEQKVALIDNFVAARGPQSPDDCESLASVVKWDSSDDTIYQLLIRHKCDWLPPKFSVPLLSQVLTKRRMTLKNFTLDSQSCDSTVSCWYAQSWIRFLRDARPRRSLPVQDILTFISTLGENANRINPFHFGLLTVSQVGKLVSGDFHSANIFDRRKYFMATHASLNEAPMVMVDLGCTKVSVDTAVVDTRPPPPEHDRAAGYPNMRPAPKRLPECVQFRIGNSPDDVIGDTPPFSCNIPLSAGFIEGFNIPQLSDPPSGSVLAIRFPTKEEEDVSAGPVARLKSFDVCGSFLGKTNSKP
jgi:hypothetical protein